MAKTHLGVAVDEDIPGDRVIFAWEICKETIGLAKEGAFGI